MVYSFNLGYEPLSIYHKNCNFSETCGKLLIFYFSDLLENTLGLYKVGPLTLHFFVILLLS